MTRTPGRSTRLGFERHLSNKLYTWEVAPRLKPNAIEEKSAETLPLSFSVIIDKINASVKKCHQAFTCSVIWSERARVCACVCACVYVCVCVCV